MEQPEGFTKDPNIISRLWWAIYGLKQAGLAWWYQLDSFMWELGFKRLKSEVGIFWDKKGNIIIAVVYVDDTFFYGPDKTLLNKIKAKFMSKWECKDLGNLFEFLWMKIAWHNQCIYIDQADYLKKILLCFQMQNVHYAPIPLLTGYHPQKHTGPVNHVLCKGDRSRAPGDSSVNYNLWNMVTTYLQEMSQRIRWGSWRE